MRRTTIATLSLMLLLAVAATGTADSPAEPAAKETKTALEGKKIDPVQESCSATKTCGGYTISCTGCPADSGSLGMPHPLKGVWVECAGNYQQRICCPNSPWTGTTCGADSHCSAQCGGVGTCVKPAGYGYGCCECGQDPV